MGWEQLAQDRREEIARLAEILSGRLTEITRLLAEVERLCTDVLMLKQGRIVDRGSPDELLTRYGRDDLEAVFLDIARDRRQGAEPARADA